MDIAGSTSRPLLFAVTLAVGCGVTGCTAGDGPGEPPAVIDPSTSLTDESRFLYGQAQLSEQGNESGTYTLPGPLMPGQEITVAASCVDGTEIAVSSELAVVGGSFGCSNPSGQFLTTKLDTTLDDLEVTVDAEAGYWLNVFVVDPTDPALADPTSEDEEELQAWSLTAVKPVGTEVERLVETATGRTTREFDVEPGTYRLAMSCRGGADTTFTLEATPDLGDFDTPARIQCGRDSLPGGSTHSIETFAEATTLRLTMNVQQETDITFVLARQTD